MSLYSLYKNDAAQKFYTSSGTLRNASNPSLVVALNLSTSGAKFVHETDISNLSTLQVELIPNNGGKFYLPSYSRYLGSYALGDGAELFFKPASDNTYNIWFFHDYR